MSTHAQVYQGEPDNGSRSWRELKDAGELASIPERIRDYSWCEAFGYAPFLITDVAEVLFAVDGERDEDSWVGCFRLKNGEYGYLTAGCDYTGWDCRASGHGDVRNTWEELNRECLTVDDCKRLGVEKILS
jgi:hypothetical protein